MTKLMPEFMQETVLIDVLLIDENRGAFVACKGLHDRVIRFFHIDAFGTSQLEQFVTNFPQRIRGTYADDWVWGIDRRHYGFKVRQCYWYPFVNLFLTNHYMSPPLCFVVSLRVVL